MNPRMWFAVLAKMVAPMEPVAAAKGMEPMLAALGGYPEQAFTDASARHVATTGRVLPDGSTAPLSRVPTYGEVDIALGKWWRSERERLMALQAPTPQEALPAPDLQDRDGLNPEVREYVRAVVQAFAAERSFNQPSSSPNRVAVKAAPVSDGVLLAAYEKLAADGNQAAATRAAMLRQRVGRAA